MLKFRKDLLVGESIKEKYEKLMPRIKKGKFVKKGVTLIAYAVNESDLFDLIPANELKFPLRKKQQLYVLGLAGSREEAIELAQKLVMQVYNATGGFDVRAYFGIADAWGGKV